MPFNGFHHRNPRTYIDYYSFTDHRGMEGGVGLVGLPIADTLPQSGHVATLDKAQIRESPPAKDRHPNH